MKRLKIWISVLYNFLLSFRGSKADIMDAKATVKEILNGKSLIRFGDGEFGIYNGANIHYQKWSKELKERFDEIKSVYVNSPRTCPYLLAVPRVFMKCSGFKLLKKRVYVSSWARSRTDFIRRFPQNIVYGDAFVFEKANREVYKKIWSDTGKEKKIVFIHNNAEYAKAFESTYDLQVFFCKCPPENAFEKIDEVKADITDLIKKNGLSADNVMFLISMGPAGKVLAFDLSMQGYHCIDTGHCWDDPLKGLD